LTLSFPDPKPNPTLKPNQVRTTSAALTAASSNELHYQAPELATGGVYQGAAADAWSLGVVGYYCLCGRLPFVAKIETTLVRRIVKLSCRPLPPHISEDASDLLFGALLVANPAFRPPLVTLVSHRWLDPEAAEAAEAALLLPVESYWDKVRRGGSTRVPKQQQQQPTLTRPRSAIQPATIKMLAAAGLPPHAVKASVGAKKLDYLYAAYTLVTERYTEAELRGSSGGAQAELRGESASSSMKSTKSTARGRGV
jgi:serine/threonine protein kinase